MRLVLQLGSQTTQFEFEWEQLCVQSRPCYVWDYSSPSKPTADKPVIYRHVVEVPHAGIVTVYVGEGASLNGPEKHNICYQYKHGGHGASRVKVRRYFYGLVERGRDEPGWTEILRPGTPVVDLADEVKRKFLQATLIAAYYWEHQKLVLQGLDVPKFLNDPF